MSGRRKNFTIADVAAQSGVAKSTASLAFSAPERVAEKTLARVLETASKLGYSPNVMASSLKSGRNNLIGLLVADMLNPHTGAILKAVQAACRAQGQIVITATSDQDIAKEEEILEYFRSLSIRGVILLGSGSGDGYIARLKSSGETFVTFDQHLPGLGADHVGLDDRAASQLLVEHLVGLGHRRIGHIAGTEGLWSAHERLAGVEEACRSAGLDPAHCPVAPGDYHAEVSEQAALALLDRPDRPTALVTANNMSAIGALRAMKRLGLQCPGDVSLASIDFLPWGDLIEPDVTCTVQPVAQMAELATRWLIERLTRKPGKDVAVARKTLYAPQLHIGTSTAPIA
ncbi:LacI family DNA-binding transcriptional regulator [Oceaniglobus trochenteri]|uniref:LacI family DNA-binding transcriptional regulator n=1 Tax=Oceaniglobus trochenteri TaxID=2763260 RepID=UPI001CFFA089|nr:LacI family DNA-binding transcriptional regulator [Oceaniglobus trochenteri]